jgi:hypothetical protein
VSTRVVERNVNTAETFRNRLLVPELDVVISHPSISFFTTTFFITMFISTIVKVTNPWNTINIVMKNVVVKKDILGWEITTSNSGTNNLFLKVSAVLTFLSTTLVDT